MTNNENKKDIRIRSNVYDSMVKSPNRAMLRATGMGDEEFNQPLIGVISTWAENTPCNIHLHDLGKVQLATPMGNKVWAYDMDRTICDIVRSRSRMADETFISSMQHYAVSPDKNLANLSLYANKMGVLSRVRQYLEVLL